VLEKHFLLAKILILPLLFYNLEDCALFMTRVKWKENIRPAKSPPLPKAWRREHGEMGHQGKMGEGENY